MKIHALIVPVLLFGLPLGVSAQRKDSAAALNATQVLGRRVFHQVSPGVKSYGPPLYKDLTDGNEETIRDFILNGSRGKMPGFKYGLEPAEIDAIVEYLRTVPKPVTRQGSGADQGPVD
jgi:mono/diheme cytochrome c family protein